MFGVVVKIIGTDVVFGVAARNAGAVVLQPDGGSLFREVCAVRQETYAFSLGCDIGHAEIQCRQVHFTQGTHGQLSGCQHDAMVYQQRTVGIFQAVCLVLGKMLPCRPGSRSLKSAFIICLAFLQCREGSGQGLAGGGSGTEREAAARYGNDTFELAVLQCKYGMSCLDRPNPVTDEAVHIGQVAIDYRSL